MKAQTIARRAGELVKKSSLDDMIENHPLATLASVVGIGLVVGRLIMPKSARLLFLAGAGLVGRELWRTQGKVDVQELIGRVRDAVGSDSRKHDGVNKNRKEERHASQAH